MATKASKDQSTGTIDVQRLLGSNFVDYATSVNVGRAIPDVRDGCKVVQRRILWSARELGLRPSGPTKKSAQVVGHCLGNYHPHGDTSVYDAMVRLAQPFSVNVPLVYGHGNFGNISGDPSAAYRYTEMRLEKYSHTELLQSVDSNAVDMRPNYDGSKLEPEVLPARVPNVLVNGAQGIAVAYATDIPPCNLGEVCDAAIALIHNPEMTEEEAGAMVLPDLPTGGIICSTQTVQRAMTSGHGSVRVRAKVHHEEDKNHSYIVATEIPYGTDCEAIINSIKDAVVGGRITGVKNAVNESGMAGVRIVVEVERGADPGAVENSLYKHTKFEETLKINLMVTYGIEYGRSNVLNILYNWLEFRRTTIRRILTHEVGVLAARLHIIDGLLMVDTDPDAVIRIIRNHPQPKTGLVEWGLSPDQAEAVLEMKLRSLSKLKVVELRKEKAEKQSDMEDKITVLRDPSLLDERIVSELESAKATYGSPRKTELSEIDTTVTAEDVMADEEFLIIQTNGGFLKRVRHEQKTQGRGGKGIGTGKVKEGDFVVSAFHANTKDHLLLFTDSGRVFDVKVWQVKECQLQAYGQPMAGLANLKDGEKIVTMLKVTNEQFADRDAYLMFATRKGLVKRTSMSEYQRILSTGIIAITLKEGDSLLTVKYVDATTKQVFMASTWGNGIIFPVDDVRAVGRDTYGVMGMHIKADEGCEICSFDVVPNLEEYQVVTVTSNGKGKRSALSEYAIQERFGKGRIASKLQEGAWLVAAVIAKPDQDLVITSTENMIRIKCSVVAELLRPTYGSRLIKVSDGHMVVDVATAEPTIEETVG